MHRFIAASLVFTLGLAVTLGAVHPAPLAAQDATPAAAPSLVVGQLSPLGQRFEALPGVDLEFLTEGQLPAAQGQSLVLFRVLLRGGEIPSHVHPGSAVLTVESGTLSWTLLAGTVWVTRTAASGTPTTSGAPEQVTEPGTELILNPGDGLIYGTDVIHTARSAGDESCTFVAAAVWETGQPAITITDEHGTPAA